MSYKIFLAELGTMVEPGAIVSIDRAAWDSDRLAHNLENLWAWNIRDDHRFIADGPAVFIEYDPEHFWRAHGVREGYWSYLARRSRDNRIVLDFYHEYPTVPSVRITTHDD